MSDLLGRYQANLVAVTDAAEAELRALYAAAGDGTLTEAEASERADVVVGRAQFLASALAELVAAAHLSVVERRDVLPAGIEPAAGTARVADAFRDHQGQDKLAAVLRGHAYDAAAATWALFLRKKAPLRHWRRRSEGGTCKPCNDLAGRGVELRTDTPMWRHTGCRCVQEVV